MNQETLSLYGNLLPLQKMESLAKEKKQQYASAQPFPHIVVDDFFSAELLDRILQEFPGSGGIDWIKFDDANQVKLASKSERDLGPHTRAFIHQLNSSSFVNFLSALTGIEGLIPDPHLEGGGLHQILPGGKLAVHADFNKNRALNLDRRLNLLLYLNKDWSDSYGGHLELWDRQMKTCQKKVAPIFNRMVVFSTDSFSHHGHPNPLTCPEGRSRKSIALYYYSNGYADENERDYHNTLFQDRPEEKVKNNINRVIKKLIPPILIDLKKLLKKDI